MRVRLSKLIWWSAAFVLAASTTAWAQSADPGPVPATEQTEAFRDTLVRMQIQREENEHKKLVEKAARILEAAEDLEKSSGGGRLSREQSKKLREIEKSARQIRSDSGGGNDESPLETKPASLDDALKQLRDLSQKLNASMGKTSRRVVSTAVIGEASEIIELVKIIRTYVE
jgi:hypothetical protein